LSAPVGAQARLPLAGSSSSASVEIRCGFDVPAISIVREVRPVDVLHLGDGLHEVSFDVTVGSNARWTLTVRPRPFVSATRTPIVEVREVQGAWVPVSLVAGPVTVITNHEAVTRHAERVVFRIRAEDHLAALQLVQIDVIPTEPR
jgi:hypothetical protein